MKVKTSELTAPALDWAVAKAMGLNPEIRHTGLYARGWPRAGCSECPQRISPSTNWAQGGPIIDRERITLRVSTMPGLDWAAFYDVPGEYHAHIREKGPTALTAAMRCYVASKLGDEVDIPEELCT